MVEIKPYTYKGHLRCFSKNLTKDQLVWHRDKGTRYIRIVSGTSWFLQLDNSIPIELIMNKIYKIPSAMHHRLINKSENDLRIVIFN